MTPYAPARSSAPDPRVSVVIANMDAERLLATCLDSLAQQTHAPFETIVVDNGSADGSVDLVRRDHPNVKVIELGANRGFALAANIGVRAASGDYVAFLNNDVVVESPWLSELVSCLERHPRAAAVTSKLLRLPDRNTIDAAGDLLTRYFRAYPRGHLDPDVGQYEIEEQVFGVSGAASLWRSDALKDIGLFDESLFFSYEDVDLNFRARLAGYECWYAPRSVAAHIRGATSRDRPEFVYFYAVRNRWSFISKDVPTSLLIRNAHRLALAETLTIARAVRRRHARTLLLAYREVLRSLAHWRRERRLVQNRSVAEPAALEHFLTPGYPNLWRRAREMVSRTRV
jgi:GT2 family glycosyltransferase